MKTFDLKGQLREATGKKDSKKLRAQELVPCVLYGNEAPIHFHLTFSELRNLIYTPNVFLINLEIGTEKYDAIIQDTQWHAVNEQLLHIDFLRVVPNKPVTIDLPINIVGLAKGIKAGGKLKVNLRKIKIKGPVLNIPDVIDVDVTELQIGNSIKIGDLHYDGIDFVSPKTNVIATVSVTRAAKAAAAGKEGKK